MLANNFKPSSSQGVSECCFQRCNEQLPGHGMEWLNGENEELVSADSYGRLAQLILVSTIGLARCGREIVRRCRWGHGVPDLRCWKPVQLEWTPIDAKQCRSVGEWMRRPDRNPTVGAEVPLAGWHKILSSDMRILGLEVSAEGKVEKLQEWDSRGFSRMNRLRWGWASF